MSRCCHRRWRSYLSRRKVGSIKSSRQKQSAETIKKYPEDCLEDELRPKYIKEEMSRGVRGKYFKQYQAGTNLVLLEPDVAAAFANSKAVDEALRELLKKAR